MNSKDNFELSFYAGQFIMNITLNCPSKDNRHKVAMDFMKRHRHPVTNIISIADAED